MTGFDCGCHNHNNGEWDVCIGAKYPEFYKTGLKAAFVLKLVR